MDREELQQMITMFERSPLCELEITCEEYSVHMKRPAHTGGTATVPTPRSTTETPGATERKPETKIITSPIVGTFYRTPSPDSPPYVQPGDRITKGAVLCTLEAMKLMNQLEAEYDCEIVAILADQGVLVEFGQPLFEVKPL